MPANTWNNRSKKETGPMLQIATEQPSAERYTMTRDGSSGTAGELVINAGYRTVSLSSGIERYAIKKLTNAQSPKFQTNLNILMSSATAVMDLNGRVHNATRSAFGPSFNVAEEIANAEIDIPEGYAIVTENPDLVIAGRNIVNYYRGTQRLPTAISNCGEFKGNVVTVSPWMDYLTGSISNKGTVTNPQDLVFLERKHRAAVTLRVMIWQMAIQMMGLKVLREFHEEASKNRAEAEAALGLIMYPMKEKIETFQPESLAQHQKARRDHGVGIAAAELDPDYKRNKMESAAAMAASVSGSRINWIVNTEKLGMSWAESETAISQVEREVIQTPPWSGEAGEIPDAVMTRMLGKIQTIAHGYKCDKFVISEKLQNLIDELIEAAHDPEFITVIEIHPTLKPIPFPTNGDLGIATDKEKGILAEKPAIEVISWKGNDILSTVCRDTHVAKTVTLNHTGLPAPIAMGLVAGYMAKMEMLQKQHMVLLDFEEQSHMSTDVIKGEEGIADTWNCTPSTNLFVTPPSVVGPNVTAITTHGLGQAVPFLYSMNPMHLMLHKGFELSDGTGPTRSAYFKL